MITAVEFNPVPGVSMSLEQDLTLVLAPNPSPMTERGTNTYILGDKSVVIIDPGPESAAHLDALRDAIDGRPVTHILLTHSHLDHSPLAQPLSQETGTPVYAFGRSDAGRSAVMAQLASEGLAGGGEGIDHDFMPDHCVADGETLRTPSGDISAHHTPGHIGNHLCFAWRDVLFTGDHVMGWASSLVSPPDGDLTDFMTSCAKLQNVPARAYYPGHGAPILEPKARLNWLIAHRQSREVQILGALDTTPQSAAAITRKVYHDVAPALLPAAERNVFAHLVDLVGKGEVAAIPQLSVTAHFVKRDVS